MAQYINPIGSNGYLMSDTFIWRRQKLCIWSHQVLAHVDVCSYCGKRGTAEKDSRGKSWHMDHVIPYGARGTNTPSNIVKACRSCNLHKSNKKGIQPLPGSVYADGHIEPFRPNATVLKPHTNKNVEKKRGRRPVGKSKHSGIHPQQMERIRIVHATGGDTETLASFEDWFAKPTG